MSALSTREYPPYQYNEYPKMVIPSNDYWLKKGVSQALIDSKTLHNINNPSYVIVSSPDEEVAVMGFLSQDRIKEEAAKAADTGEYPFLLNLCQKLRLPVQPGASIDDLRRLLDAAATTPSPKPELEPETPKPASETPAPSIEPQADSAKVEAAPSSEADEPAKAETASEGEAPAQ
jgi:hypothetical protein